MTRLTSTLTSRIVRITLIVLLVFSITPTFTFAAFADEGDISSLLADTAIEDTAQEGAPEEETFEQDSNNQGTIGQNLGGIVTNTMIPDISEPTDGITPSLDSSETDVELLAGEAEIVIRALEAGQVTITCKWSSPVVIIQSGYSNVSLFSAASETRTVSAGQTITVREYLAGTTFRQWASAVPKPFVSGAACVINSMPAMSAFTTDAAGTIAPDYFFHYFNGGVNVGGSLTQLPVGSFNISNITTIGNNYFSYFNYNGALVSLPAGSFNTSKISSVASQCFSRFNYHGSLTALPTGSFNTSNIATAGSYYFSHFNSYGSLTQLPVGSFKTTKLTTAKAGFFQDFNSYGSLTQLPVGSFDTAGISTAEDWVFGLFNLHGALTSLPEGSFNTSRITAVGNSFFHTFNSFGSLTQLPAGSFDLSRIASTGIHFFNGFNRHGSLAQLPEDSFDLSSITTASNSFFATFNNEGCLTQLPAGSFDTSKIATTGNDFFYQFNAGGSLSSLPEDSFNTSKISSVGERFFAFFNSSGLLTKLPADSFDTSGIITIGSSFYGSFDRDGSLTSLPVSFKLPQIPDTVGGSYCQYMFNNSKLTRGDSAIPLYFARASSGTFTSTDITPVNPPKGTTVYVDGGSSLEIEEPSWKRLHGANRYGTMREIAKEGWDTSEYVIVASGANFPDALAASALAGLYDAPIILSVSESLSAEARSTIEDLGASRVILVGGEAMLSDDTEQAIRAISGVQEVRRLSGPTRYETALSLYKDGIDCWSNTAIIVSGETFADALSISPFANVTRSPIFLASKAQGLSNDALKALKDGGFSSAIIVGGDAAVSTEVEIQLSQVGITAPIRLAGAHRYETSACVSAYSVANSNGALAYDTITCAAGTNFPDALAGGSFAAKIGSTLLLVAGDSMGHFGIDTVIKPNASVITAGYVLGGEAMVSADLFDELVSASK